MNKRFEELGLSKDILKSIEDLGYIAPSKIQNEIIPLILSGEDVVGEAQTGTGKTLAYASAILSKLDSSNNSVKVIVLVPTRELAIQVSNEFQSLNTYSNFNVVSVYGGAGINTQINLLKKHVDIVVGTPGRVMDLMNRSALKINKIDYFVLDEADEMLNMGFIKDIEFIFENTRENKNVLLFSATMPEKILSLASNYMKKDYKYISIKEKTKTAINVAQYYYKVSSKNKLEAMVRVIDSKNYNKCIIFCKTKKECDELLTEFSKRNYSVEVIHGDIIQKSRIEAVERFKQGSFKYLIATDVVARGIHIDNVDAVINYNLAEDIESYIHRIGRTGRVDNLGEAITFVSNKEVGFLKDIEKFTKSKIIECELPDIEKIVNNKYEEIIKKANNYIENKSNVEAIPYVRDFNKNDLINFASALLKMAVSNEIGLDKNKVIINEENHRNKTKGFTRVFITIGKMDDMDKKKLVNFIEKNTKIGKDYYRNIEVLTKFTFMDISDEKVEEVINKINNMKLNNRIVHIERAKK